MKIASIARNQAHSPNMTANDAAILDCIAKELGMNGAEVIPLQENEPLHGFDAIFHMSRTSTTLQNLKETEEKGTIVINTPKSVENCSRLILIQRLDKAGTPQPTSCIIDDNNIAHLHYPAWIKRADGWSCHKNDVCFVADASAAKKAILEMRSRGITEHIYSEHIEGDIIKFYGIGNQFFHYSYPSSESSKFGLEKINGTPHHYSFSIEEMKRTVFSAAAAIGLDIYGGDCIVDKNGSIYIIDLNDFPSFSSIRHEAAKKIAEHIIEKIKKKHKQI